MKKTPVEQDAEKGPIRPCRVPTGSATPQRQDPRVARNEVRPNDCQDAESQRVLSDASFDVAYALGEQAAEAYFRELLERKAS
jgi:hypothetical protein